jgi:hypothetical protein
MKRVLAIARLTFAEGIRMRIVLVLLVLLVGLMVAMPFTLRGDETLAGRVQNFLAYALGALGILLSVATVFFSCATLTRELETRSLHLVVTKPVSRIQILIGKWLGVNMLNLVIMLICGAAIYGFASFLASKEESFTRDRYKLRDVVWTARVAANPVPPFDDMRRAAEQYVQEQLSSGAITPDRQREAVADRLKQSLKQWRAVGNGQFRFYRFENLPAPQREDAVYQVRYKIRITPLTTAESAPVEWMFCNPETGAWLQPAPQRIITRSDRTEQFLARADYIVRDGEALLWCGNPYDQMVDKTFHFDGQDNLQLLYQVGSFEANFAKALLLIFFQVALLSALGIFFGVFVSFPVACLCVSACFVLSLGMPFWLESIGEDLQVFNPSSDPYGYLGPIVRPILIPLMKFAFPDFIRYSGTAQLVEGEYIPIALLLESLLRTVVYGGALLLLPGWLLFSTKEVAEVNV